MILPPAPHPRQNHSTDHSSYSEAENIQDGAINRMIAAAMDSQLLALASSDTSFTISDVRNALLSQPELEHLNPTLLRYRVRDRLNSLQRDGLAQRVGVRGKNRPLYRLELDALPTNAQEVTPATDKEHHAASDTSCPPPCSDIASLAEYLEEERERLRADMQALLSEVEHYDHLIEQFPDQQARISPLMEAAMARGGELKGRMNANIQLRQSLVAEGKRA